MTNHLESIAGFTSTVVSAIFGAITLPSLAQIASNDSMPDWAKWVLGPLGALVGMIVAIRWLTDRLDKQELKMDAREAERDADRKTLISVLTQNSITMEQNSSVLRDVKTVMDRHNP